MKMKLGDDLHEVKIIARRPHLVVSIDGRHHTIDDPGRECDGPGTLVLDGAAVSFARVSSGGSVLLHLDGRAIAVEVIDPLDEAEGSGHGRDEILAPMPGAVVQVHKAAGAAVTRGEAVLTIESMKLQTTLVAPRAGTLLAVLKGAGDTFEKDEVVARLAPVEGDQ
ncbi:hypothetical protein GCM10007301_09930 [Azorhizobium oxalatiphilum]|uniref:Lipoyl-binding domain-containing protein n=1 Tax=Azorhizobium oxalatiphilum TaxID=980631 RepID=A0A917BQP5_9HYPH|nr:biotin/lipoyl-containing protein [Azorhizobium oxalatiphilum]GGF52451.1 hypothetical protein GCM10007301_09930 [Azorhizobium oxalatiphilum]